MPYVGETIRHISTLVREHIFKAFRIVAKFLAMPHLIGSNDSFSILDHASTKVQLKIKEAIHI